MRSRENFSRKVKQHISTLRHWDGLLDEMGPRRDDWTIRLMIARAPCYSDSAQQGDDYRSRSPGVFDCELGGHESREYRGCEEGG